MIDKEKPISSESANFKSIKSTIKPLIIMALIFASLLLLLTYFWIGMHFIIYIYIAFIIFIPFTLKKIEITNIGIYIKYIIRTKRKFIPYEDIINYTVKYGKTTGLKYLEINIYTKDNRYNINSLGYTKVKKIIKIIQEYKPL